MKNFRKEDFIVGRLKVNSAKTKFLVQKINGKDPKFGRKIGKKEVIANCSQKPYLREIYTRHNDLEDTV